jgi:hypothetical protein
MQRQFHGICEPALDVLSDDQAIYHNMNVMFLVFVRDEILFKELEFSVHLDTGEPVSAKALEKVTVLSFLPPDEGGQYLHLCPFFQGHDLIDHLLRGLGRNFPATLWTVRMAYPGKEQP